MGSLDDSMILIHSWCSFVRLVDPEVLDGGCFQASAHQQDDTSDQVAIRYGHVFAVTGDLADSSISPRDAAAMRSTEDSVPGVHGPEAVGGGFSAATAAEYNQALGAVAPGQASDAAAVHGITVTQTVVPGGRVVTEFVVGTGRLVRLARFHKCACSSSADCPAFFFWVGGRSVHGC
jgi:hypothetical protein